MRFRNVVAKHVTNKSAFEIPIKLVAEGLGGDDGWRAGREEAGGCLPGFTKEYTALDLKSMLL